MDSLREFYILDGGLATHLESKGFDLNHPLWSARILLEDPQAVYDAHLDFLKAGSDCFCTVSYQLTYQRCLELGISDDETVGLLLKSVELACRARDQFWRSLESHDRMKPLVAGSIGPFGAYLANASEYTGDYQISEAELFAFHEKRWKFLADTSVDLLACETIPNFLEVKALVKLLRQTPSRKAWISLSCKNTRQLADGTDLGEVATFLKKEKQLVALGVNCIDPHMVTPILKTLKKAAAGKTLIAYPNSGEQFDKDTKKWHGKKCTADWPNLVKEWYSLGARWIGGCCRTGPEDIFTIRKSLNEHQKN